MHIYLLARGQKDHLQKWINDLSEKYLPYEYEPGKLGMLQIGVREIKLLEIAIPESQLDSAMKFMGQEGYQQYKFLFWIKNLIRKILGLKKIPDFERDLKREIENKAVGIHYLGLKKDVYRNGIELI